jgi:hypothetical protein
MTSTSTFGPRCARGTNPVPPTIKRRAKGGSNEEGTGLKITGFGIR